MNDGDLNLLMMGLAGAGLFGFVCSYFLSSGTRRFKRNAIAVKLRALEESMKEEGHENGSYAFEQNYEIIEGEHAGIRGKARFLLRGKTNSAGDRVDGLYNPETGAIESKKGVSRLVFISRQSIFFSLCLCMGAAYIYYGLNMK